MLNNILEISSKAATMGRVPIKIALLKIHDDPEETNKNGIHWKKEYVLNNIESAKNMPICASFLDDDKEVPYDHGFTGDIIENNKKEPTFTNSESVGVIESASIEEITINGETINALIGNGVIFKQRYPNFTSWLRKNYAISKVDTSIEIMGTEVNDNKIVYEEDEPTDDFRTPKEYYFSSTCIISVPPADDKAIVLEVAQKKNKDKEEEKKMEFDINEIKSVIQSTITELNNDKQTYENKIAELNTEIASKDDQIKECQSTIADKDSEINTLTATVEQVQKALDDLKKEHETYWAEREALEKELGKLKAEKRIAEMNQAISAYTEDEQKFAESEINSFKENPLEGNIETITSKICVGIVAKQKEDAKTSEINSAKKNEEVKIEDIFSEMCSEKNVEDDDEDINIF